MNQTAIEIFNDKKGQFRFRVKARNGEIICQSEAYTTKAKCKNGIYALDRVIITTPDIKDLTRKEEK